MTENKDYEVGVETDVDAILKELAEGETIPWEEVKKELGLDVESVEGPAPVKKSKRKKEVKKNESPQPEPEVEQAEEDAKPIQTVSQTDKKYGWMVNERSHRSRKYYTGKGSRY